jgi:DNA mismatch repair protein MutH
MKLDEALPLLQAACGVPFGKLFAGHPTDLFTNKGHAGQLLLRYIGLKLDCNLCDFEDGELKTNKSLASGTPVETMFITQISEQIDTLVSVPPIPFDRSALYQKIRNLVYLPVVKTSADCAQWYYICCVRVRAEPGSTLYDKFRSDYEAICAGLRLHIQSSPDGFIHTTNGPHYIQVRSKDSTPYHPIYSRTYGKYVSNKNHAFYFMKQFMLAAAAGTL